MKAVLRYFKHIFLTVLVLVPAIILFGISQGAGLHYGDNPLALDWEREGPYVFVEDDDSLSVNYVHGNQDDGFYLEQKSYPADEPARLESHFRLDSTSFGFTVETDFEVPGTTYTDDQPIFAISDIESGFRTFRDMLIAAGVIDEQLNWTFGEGHLVLNGDFVDRGFSTTQVLWFIYKLEQDARRSGGHVHFILGNHEIKNLQGNFDSSSPKYFHVASILGKRQFDLYGPRSVLGRWLASKNTIEIINGHLFVHGGIHPDLADSDLSLDEINRIVRANYRQPFYPKPEEDMEQFLISTHTGPSWYRGYFKEDLTQEEVERSLSHFGAKAAVVGHTIQWDVNAQFNGRVLAIDVQHPNDYHKNWPPRHSEALLIDGDEYYRVLDTGERELL